MDNFSYWEINTWLSNVDFTIVGSGIVGLNCALQLRHRFPKAKIIVLEKGLLPQGASTKNAGFACFGSLSEILSDLKSHTEEDVYKLVEKRLNGLQLLRELLSDTAIGYKQYGGYELFTEKEEETYRNCAFNIAKVNALLQPLFRQDTFTIKPTGFGFKKVMSKSVFTPFEGQIDTGKMMQALLQKAHVNNIQILNNITVEDITDTLNSVSVKTNRFEFSTSKLLVATNGFASQLLNEDVKPARAQVLITKPIKDLNIKGTFHLDEGFYYFRNINDRILFGGGRNLDFKTEETTSFGITPTIQNTLEEMLTHIILPSTPFEIEHRWSGIMGVGTQKRPIVKQISNNVFCGVRLGGMGIAIGTLIGQELADLL